jgi:hypothetical protein
VRVRSASGVSVVLSALLSAVVPGRASAQAAEPPPEAQPEEPAPASSDGSGPPLFVELAGQAAYVTPPIRGGTNPFGAGFGARIGLDFSGLYVGVSVMDFLGGKDVDVGYRALFYGLDVGYGVHVPAFGKASWLVRPRLGVGVAAVYYTDPSLAADVVTSASRSSSASDTLTVNNVFLQPGATLELTSGAYFAAVDASVLLLPGIAYGGADPTTWLCYGTQLQLGFRF